MKVDGKIPTGNQGCKLMVIALCIIVTYAPNSYLSCLLLFILHTVSQTICSCMLFTLDKLVHKTVAFEFGATAFMLLLDSGSE